MSGNAGGVLARIVASTRRSVAGRMAATPIDTLRKRVQRSDRSLEQALRRKHTGFIFECKRASPSRGLLRADFDLGRIAESYAPFADGISVLTDEPYFQGALENLRVVRERVKQPVLCKDFVVDPYQLYEARDYGADAALLMCSVLDQKTLITCLAVAKELALDALVEVHNETELARAADCGATLVGINNRNLQTLEVSLDTTEALIDRAPQSACVISESGISSWQDVNRLREHVDGFLVGTRLMIADNIDSALRSLLFRPVKICGLTRNADARAAWNLGASYGGLIFAPSSPRCVSLERACDVRMDVPLQWVGVFVNAPIDQVADYVQEAKLSAVQLHGEETPSYVAELRARLSDEVKIWQAVRVGDCMPQLDHPHVDRIVLDSYQAGTRGGSGTSFDWSLVEGAGCSDRLILAGGLRPENISTAALQSVWGLDVNSGVESAPGIKDVDLLRSLFANLRA